MKIVISSKSKVKKFTDIFRNLKDLVNTINIYTKEDNIYAQGMDTSHISLFEFYIGKDWFNAYSCERSDTIGVSCELFYKVISCIEENQSIEINKKYEDDKINIILSGEGFTKEFSLSTVHIEEELLSIPDVEYSSDIKMVSKDYSDLITQLQIFGNQLRIKCGETIELESTGGDEELGSMKVTIKEEDILEYALEEGITLDIEYRLSYIKRFMQFMSINTTVNLHFSERSPMKVCYDLDDWMDENEEEEEVEMKNYIRFYLAPVIDDEE